MRQPFNPATVCKSLLVLLSICAMTARAQTSASNSPALMITVNATEDRVRITAPSSVVQIHLEVYDATGQKLFDEELRGANVFDWHLQNGQAQRLAAGDYVCVVTAKTISGKLTQKIGAVTVAESSAGLRPGDSQQFTPPQAQAIGPVEADSSWTIMSDGDNQTTTVIAHNGTEGQMIRGRGALSFRVGDFFRGKDEEQMRLTEEGNLGIGTSTPQSKLEVAGAIRAERFVVVKPSTPGSKAQTTNATQTTDSASSVQPLVAGTGSQNQIAKWTDNAGTLGDSGITETAAGNVGIGTKSPQGNLHIFGTSGTVNLLIGNAINSESRLRLSYDNAADKSVINSYRGASGYKPLEIDAGNLLLNANSGGNVGIQTTNATAPLTVQAPGNAIAAKIFGRNDDISALDFYKHDGTTLEGRLLAQTGQLTISDSAGTQVLTVATGNVGIGTTTPSAKLDVNGDINTATQYNIGGDRALAVTTSNGLPSNVFVGPRAGSSTGPFSGLNVFVGVNSGQANFHGIVNSFFGADSGASNQNGSFNSFFGESAGGNNTSGQSNVFLGEATGFSNGTGSFNIFIGASTTVNLTQHTTGRTNQTGNNNILIGPGADVGSDGLTNAIAIGYEAQVAQSNSLVLGSINGTNGATADTKVGIGTAAPTFRLHVIDPLNQGLRVQTNTSGGNVASFGGNGSFQIDSSGVPGGRVNVLENGNVAIGSSTPPTDKLYVNGDTRVNGTLRVPGGSIYVANPNTLIITSPNGACWGITVNNSGALSTFSTTCP